MKFHITKNGDTLRRIARIHRLETAELLSHNRHIAHPDIKIPADRVIHVPSPRTISVPPDLAPCPPGGEEEYLDHWVPLASLDEMERKEYDVLIVGTGAGGGAVLWRLCSELGADGKRIGVVEAGDLILPTHALNIPTLNTVRYNRYWTNPKFWKKVGPPQFAFRQFLGYGGRTIFWNAVTARMHPLDMITWPISVKEMGVYYNIAEEIMNVTSQYPVGSMMSRILLDRLRKGGFPESVYQPLAVDLQPTVQGEIHSNVWFSSILFAAKALNIRHFDLAVKARAVEVYIEDGRAVGVKVMSPDKKAYTLRANTIVLSTSTLESPRILLHSGLRLPAIGRYLAHHLRINATGLVNRIDFPEVLGTLGLLIPRTEERPYQIQIQGPGTGREYYTYHDEVEPLRSQWAIDLEASGEVEPRQENRLYLDPVLRDEYGVPEIRIEMTYSDRDIALLRVMDRGIKQAAAAMRAPLVAKDDFATCVGTRGKDTHETGTCRMGDDPATSVTNRFGQVHGVQGLYVADNSVIPTGGAANPTLTTVALSIHTADHIVRQWLLSGGGKT